MQVYLVSFIINENNALHNVVQAMVDKANIQCNKLMKLDNLLLMYGIYNAKNIREINQNCTWNS